MLRSRWFWLVLGALILLPALYFLVLRGTLIVKTDTLDPAAIEVAGTELEGVREARASLPIGPHRVRVRQADYEPATVTAWVAPWATRTITVRPELSALGRQKHGARVAAATFVETAGTFDAADFETYLARLRKLVVPALFEDVYQSPEYVKGRSFNQLIKARSEATADETSLLELGGDRAVVEVLSTIKLSSEEGELTVRKKYTVTLRERAGEWVVTGLREEYL